MKKQNANWFNAMVRFHNTIRFINRTWNVPHVIAREIQHAAAMHQDEALCNKIAAVSTELCSQIGT